MSTRESRNSVKIGGFRVGHVPIDKTETVYQGDMMAFDTTNHRASKATSASGSTFVGVSETQNPVATAGSPEFLSSQQLPRIVLYQSGLFEFCWGVNEMVYPWDQVIIDSDAQTCKKGASNSIGYIDPGYGAAGYQATASGDRVRVWITVPARYLLGTTID